MGSGSLDMLCMQMDRRYWLCSRAGAAAGVAQNVRP